MGEQTPTPTGDKNRIGDINPAPLQPHVPAPPLAPPGSTQEDRNLNSAQNVPGKARPSVAQAPRTREVQTPAQADELRKRIEENPAEGLLGAPLADLPPLTENDVVQGPNDRRNRRPTATEIDHGRVRLERQQIEDGLNTDFDFEPKTNDDVHEKDKGSAPKDVPADPRSVAESRGQIKPKPGVDENRVLRPGESPRPVTEGVGGEELDEEADEIDPARVPAGTATGKTGEGFKL